MQWYDNSEAKERSLMYKQKTLCDGARTGKQCRHYWAIVEIPDVANPDHLRKGEKSRYCTLVPGDLATLTGQAGAGEGMAVACNRYEASERDYDVDFETFDPLTPEEIAAIQGRPYPDPAEDSKDAP